MAPSLCTLLVVLSLLITIMLVSITQRVFAPTRSRVSRQNTDDHNSQSPQHHDDDHKSRSQQDFEDHKSLPHQHHLKSTAHHVLTRLGSTITAVTTSIQRVLALARSRHSQQGPAHSQQDLKSTTLHVTYLLQTIIPIMQSSHSVFCLARSRPAPNTHDDLLPHSHQETLRSTALHASSCTQVVSTSTVFTCRFPALARLRPAQNIHLDLLPHSHPGMTLHAFLCLQVTDMITALLHCLLVRIASWLAQAGRRPYPQQDHRTPHRDEQSTTYNTVSSAALRPRMHWIQNPASYSMMQHQSFVALYRESAMANTYVPTPP
jgi:hypothetical protein